MKLAINGGKPVRTKLFPAYRNIGAEEKEAVIRTLDSGVLSRYLGCWHEDFYGGPVVQRFEEEWAEYFGVKHAIAVNSCTSGLYCAIGAAGVGPGDEVIVSPYTMSASAVTPLIFNAVPVFADIEAEYFCLDPESVEKRITERTKAIVVVDIFGLSYDVDKINAIAKKHGLIVIEDSAQAPGAKYRGKYAGTLGDIGVFSLNYHKHIHCGEGGVVVTDNDELAEKVRLIRNHAEAVVEAKGVSDIVNMVGFNFRLTEPLAAIGIEQLKKLDALIKARKENCEYLNEKLSRFKGLSPARVREGCEHSYYVHPLLYDEKTVGVSRELFVKAVRAELAPTELREKEGVIFNGGYVKPLYLQPMFQKKIAYGKDGCPFKCPWYRGEVNYDKGICPTAERMHEKELIIHELMRPPMAKSDLDDVVNAIDKVLSNIRELQ